MNLHSAVKNRQTRQKVFSAPIDLTQDFQTPRYPKSEAAAKFIDKSLKDNFIFASLPAQERRLLIDAMMVESVPADTVIIQQGEVGRLYFYIVEEGHVSFEVDNKNVGSCKRGGSFGEIALLYDCPRVASCVATTDCRLWKVGQKTFRYLLANHTNAQQKGINEILRKVPFLTELDDSDLLRVSDALTPVKFREGERIINKGDAGEAFYIIREGTAKVHGVGFGDSTYVDQTLGPGDFFGERALLTGDPRVANVTATSSCTCLFLSRDTFDKVLGPLQGLIDNAMKKRSLLGVPLFCNSQFQPHELASLMDLVVETTFEAGKILAEAGKPTAQNLYIIRSGDVSIANDNGIINNLKDADYFGDNFLKEDAGFVSKQTITVQAETVCGVLSRQAIESVIGNISRLGKPLPPASHNLNKAICFKDLKKLSILGTGSFGKVWLVSHEDDGAAYALKQLSKHEIIGHRQVKGVIREKNIMSSIDHPFLVNLVSSFQDDCCLYMLIGLVQGGELFSVIHTDTHNGIPNENSRFYAACILEALAHLHHRSIGYRDLKPENVLVDEKGYCVVVDLGFAKMIANKTYTLCGTPEYLAPEIILSRGHDKGVDYWAFGVLIYEMLVGQSAFYSHGTDQRSMFKRIVYARYSFPDSVVVDDLAQDLIGKLLIRRPTERLGCLSGADGDVRKQPWFSAIDVDELLKRNISAPWVPTIKNALDATHFDSHQDLENEPSSNKPPLSDAQQEQFADF